MASKLGIDDLGEVWEALLDACTKSYEIGLKLNIPVATLERIHGQFEAPRDKLREALKVWLKTAPKPTWQDILDALRSSAVEESRLATTVEAKYCTTAWSSGQARARSVGQASARTPEVQLPQPTATDTQLVQDYKKLLQQLQDSQKQNQKLTHQNQQLTRQVEEKRRTIDNQETQLQQKQCTIDSLETHLQQVQQGIQHTVGQLKQELLQTKKEKEAGEKQLRQLTELVLKQKQTIGGMRAIVDLVEQQLKQAEQNVDEKECTIAKLEELNQETISQLKRTIEEKDRLLQLKDKQLQQIQERVEQQKRTIKERDGQLHQQDQRGQVETQPPTGVMQQKTVRDMRWQKASKAPKKMHRGTVASDSNVAYFSGPASAYISTGVDIHSYDSDTQEWCRLPDTPPTHFSLVVAQGMLTMVGGILEGVETNSLLSLMGEKKDKKWLPHFPAMPTRRWNTAVICSSHSLIVAGGSNTENCLATVEVLDIGTRQWSIASSLTHPFTNATISMCGERLYMLGGINQTGSWTRSVLTCSVPELLCSCQPHPLAQMPPKASVNQSTIWQCAADAPHYSSSCATLCGQLVAVGGADQVGKSTAAFAVYDEGTGSWKDVGFMLTARSLGLVAILKGKMLVVGGYAETSCNYREILTDVVETLL